jgi:hypothetical protein
MAHIIGDNGHAYLQARNRATFLIKMVWLICRCSGRNCTVIVNKMAF